MLGLCCQWLDDSGKNALPSRRLQLGRYNKGLYSDERIKSTYITNLTTLRDTLPTIIASGIRVFRVSSAMFNLYDKVSESFWNNDQVINLLGEIGSIVLNYNVRFTMHPDQFVVLSSDNPETVNNAIREMNFHGWVFDQMGLPRTPYYAINVHGGGKHSDVRMQQILCAIKQLSPAARSRMTLENCEFGWSVKQLVDVGVPVVFDSHHHSFNTGDLDGDAAMRLALQTWPDGIRPLTHLSNSPEHLADDAPAGKRRAHSDFIRAVPDYQREANNEGLIDIDIEAKKKNLAIFDVNSKLGIKL